MKGQSSLLIIIAVIMVVIISWAFVSFKQANVSESQLFSLLISKITGKIDTLRGFFRNALIVSSHMGTDVVGADQTKTFYCNGITVPTENQINIMLSNSTLRILNSYVTKLDIEDPSIQVKVENFTCVHVPVDRSDLDSGLYDENFSVNAYGSKIEVLSNENRIESTNEIFDYVNENRFWLLYRKMGDWTEANADNIYNPICNCMNEIDCESGNACDSGLCPVFSECIHGVYQNLAASLQNYIDDPYIRCTGVPACCYTKIGPSCKDIVIEGCYEGIPGECSECHELPDEESCLEKISSASWKCKGKCRYWELGWANIKGLITCKDKKYQLSVPGKERYLEFTMEVVSSMTKNGINKKVGKCQYKRSAGSCVCSFEPHCVASCSAPIYQDNPNPDQRPDEPDAPDLDEPDGH